MPVYQYACTECASQLEVRQSFTDDPLTTCPQCSGRLRKVLSAVGVVFKGSGFYRTDSRSSSNGEGTKDAGTDGSGGSGGTAGDKKADKKGGETASSAGGSATSPAAASSRSSDSSTTKAPSAAAG